MRERERASGHVAQHATAASPATCDHHSRPSRCHPPRAASGQTRARVHSRVRHRLTTARCRVVRSRRHLQRLLPVATSPSRVVERRRNCRRSCCSGGASSSHVILCARTRGYGQREPTARWTGCKWWRRQSAFGCAPSLLGDHHELCVESMTSMSRHFVRLVFVERSCTFDRPR